jgi:hypothetical protein
MITTEGTFEFLLLLLGPILGNVARHACSTLIRIMTTVLGLRDA